MLNEKLKSGMYIIAYYTTNNLEYRIKEIGKELLKLLQIIKEDDILEKKILSIFSDEDAENIIHILDLHEYKSFETILNSLHKVELKCKDFTKRIFKVKAFPIFSESTLEITTLIFFRDLTEIEQLWALRRRLKILNFECQDDHFSVIPKHHFIDGIKSVYFFAQKHGANSLLVGIEIIEEGYLNSKIESVIKILKNNIRVHDEIGMLSEKKVGILFIGCKEIGRKSIPLRILSILKEHGLLCTLYEVFINNNTSASVILDKFPEISWEI